MSYYGGSLDYNRNGVIDRQDLATMNYYALMVKKAISKTYVFSKSMLLPELLQDLLATCIWSHQF